MKTKAKVHKALHTAKRLAYQYPYVITCAVVMLSFLGLAYAVAAHIDVPVRDPEGSLMGKRMVSPLLLMVVSAFLDALRRSFLMRRSGSREPLFRLAVATFIDRWWWKRLALATIGFLCFAFTYLAYRNLKSFVSLISYRSYDQEMLEIDRWLAMGHDPAALLHSWLGTSTTAHILSYVYLLYIPLVPVTVAMALAFVERMREAYVFVAAYMWNWILGTVSYYAIPTLGPFASRARLFEMLDRTNVTRLQESLEQHRFDLHADNIGEDWVQGIAGFASLHVSVVVTALLLMIYYRQRTLAWIVAIFLIPTVTATIYFGWHFLLDDIVGVIIGWLAVHLGRATVYPKLLLVWKRRIAHDLDRKVIGDTYEHNSGVNQG